MRSAILAVLALVIGLVVLSTLQDEEGSVPDSSATANEAYGTIPRPAAAASEEAVTPDLDREHPGYKVYTRRGCNVCHGPDLAGTNMAPALTGVSEHWERETLARYLANPDSAVRANPRLRELDGRYDMFVMPAYQIPEEELAMLITLMLGE